MNIEVYLNVDESIISFDYKKIVKTDCSKIAKETEN